MSPRDDVFTCWSHRFPRVSGDEPSPEAHLQKKPGFSPRERG